MTNEEMIANEMSDTNKKIISLIEQEVTKARQEKCFEQNKDGTIRPCEVMKENVELKKNAENQQKISMERFFEIKRLNEQIEKMKCCTNCKHYKHRVGCMKADKPIHRQCDIDNWKSWELEK